MRVGRAAVIDVGTNSVLLTIASAGPASPVAELERATITRLGEAVDRTRQLSSAAVERTLACLEEYAALIRAASVDAVALVGTSALRDAGGGQSFRERASRLVGTQLEVISGAREAELSFRGAISGLSITGPLAVFDIGGGSTEIVLGAVQPPRAEVHTAQSFDMGSVRLTERHIRSDPPRTEELEALRADIHAIWAKADPGRDSWSVFNGQVVGVAGTVTTLAALALGLPAYDPARVHGAHLEVSAIDDVTGRLAALPLAQRQKLPSLEPRRADVIVAGAVLCSELLRHLGAATLVVSDRGVRWGLLEELFSASLTLE